MFKKSKNPILIASVDENGARIVEMSEIYIKKMQKGH